MFGNVPKKVDAYILSFMVDFFWTSTMSNFERENPNLVIKIDIEPDNRTRLVRKAFRLKQQPRAYKNSSNKTKPTIMQKNWPKTQKAKG